MVFKSFIKKALIKTGLLKRNSHVNNDKEVLSKNSIGNNVDFAQSFLGEYSYISPNSKIHSTTIGKFCSIGPDVIIGYGDHPIEYLSTSPLFYYGTQKFDIKIAAKDFYIHHKQVTIGNDVWVGANVYIKNGIQIGDGAVIAAGAVVVKNVPAYAIVGGVPAKLIRYRFQQKEIEDLLRLKWWEWDIEKLKENKHLFINTDIRKVIDKIKEIN